MLHHSEAEKSILGAALKSAEAYARASAELVAEDFSVAEHQLIFAVMQRMYREGKDLDPLTLADALGASLPEAGGFHYLTELLLNTITAQNIESHIELVREESRKRHLLKDLESITTSLTMGDDIAYIDQVQAALDKAKSKTGGGTGFVKDYAAEAYMELVNGTYRGLGTGFIMLDQMLGGLNKGHVCVVAGRPSMGKTSFAANIATNVAIAGGCVAFFTLEQPRVDIIKRILISISGCSEYDAAAGNQEQLEKLVQTMARTEEMRLSVIDDAYAMDKIRECCYAVKRQAKGLDLVVIDYLGMIKTRQRRNGTREQEVAELSRSVKLLAREMDCPVIMLSQLSRAPEQRTEKKPVLADLRDSGSIEQDADEVVMLYRPWVYDKTRDPAEATIIVAKNRNGRTGEIDARWDGEHFTYTDCAFEQTGENTPFDEEQEKWEEI